MAFAALLEAIAISGCRKSDGTPAASGRVWVYNVGTTTAARLYADADGLAQLTNPVTLDAAGRAVIYVRDPVRVLAQDVAGGTVSDTSHLSASAGDTGVKNLGFTGVNPLTLATEPGGHTNVDAVLTSAFESFQGVDWKVKVASGATARPVVDMFSEIWISVKSFGAKGDGLQVDTPYIQAAINLVSSRGGGIVYLPPGTYRTDAPLVFSLLSGVSLRGAGIFNTAIFNTGAGNAITVSGSSSFVFEDFLVTHSTSSVGAGIAFADCNTFTVSRVSVESHQIGIDMSGVCADTALLGVRAAAPNNAAARGVRYSLSGAAVNHLVVGGRLLGIGGKGIELNGTVGDLVVIGAYFPSTNPTGILFNAALTGTRFVVAACPSLGGVTLPFDLSGLATDVRFRQWGNEVNGTVVSQANGGTFTPNRALGDEFHFRATSGGAGTSTIAAPTPVPTTTMRGTLIRLRLTAAAGGAVTWSMAAYTLVGAAAPAGADGTTVEMGFEWDVQTSKWREQYRAITAT